LCFFLIWADLSADIFKPVKQRGQRAEQFIINRQAVKCASARPIVGQKLQTALRRQYFPPKAEEYFGSKILR
jgi:hypothetical protein